MKSIRYTPAALKALVGRPGARLRVGDYRVIFVETAVSIEVLAIGDRRDIYASKDGGMTPQFIKTEGGEELVVLTRHAYDALLARSGDEAAEDRAVARKAEDYLAAGAAGDDACIPHWFAVSVAEHGSAVKAARKRSGASRKDMACGLGISQVRLALIERGQAELSPSQRSALAERTGIDADWLV